MQNADYPVRLDIEYPDRLSRLLIFVKWILVIPHYIVLFVLAIAAWFATVISWFAVLVTGRYPQGLFDFIVGLHRWGLRVTAYLLLQTDRYPPFSLDDDPWYPVHLTVEYPQRIARWRPLVSWLLVIPVAIASVLMVYVAYVVVFLAWFAILITGRFPQGMFRLVLTALRWQTNVNLYGYWMTDRYPSLAWS